LSTRKAGQYAWFRERLAVFTREARSIHEEQAVEARHRTRAAARRLDAGLSALQLDGNSIQKLSRSLKKVRRQLGGVRDLDVLILTIQQSSQDTQFSSTALHQLAAAAEEARKSARDRLAARLPPAKVRRLGRRLERVVQGLETGRDGSDPHNDQRLTQTLIQSLSDRSTHHGLRARSAIEMAGTVYVPERLHAVRIAVKKLRYSLELGAEVRRRRKTAGLAALKTAQELLGLLQDRNVLVEHARQVQSALPTPDLTAWRDLGLLVRAAEDECRGLHARYMHDRARLMEIVDRIAGAKSISRRVAG
jgi:CHAD domain-containing protein